MYLYIVVYIILLTTDCSYVTRGGAGGGSCEVNEWEGDKMMTYSKVALGRRRQLREQNIDPNSNTNPRAKIVIV